jgi:hypothetical protein
VFEILKEDVEIALWVLKVTLFNGKAIRPVGMSVVAH